MFHSHKKAPCDTSPVFDKPLIGFHLNQSKHQNSREWLLKLQKEKLNIMLDDKDTRDDWVNAIRSAIKSKLFRGSCVFRRIDIFRRLFDIFNSNQIQHKTIRKVTFIRKRNLYFFCKLKSSR